MSEGSTQLDSPAPRVRTLQPLLSLTGGLAVASLYYAQPILGHIADALQLTAADVGLVVAVTQLGYAIGILLLAPLGDRLDRRRLVAWKLAGLTASLLLTATAWSLPVLLGAVLFTGLCATAAQDIVPTAAALAPAESRARAVGETMTGLLLGIVVSRVFSGYVGQIAGWRTVYGLAASAVAVAGLCLYRRLPAQKASTQMGYQALLGSMLGLLRRHRPLQLACLVQGLLSMGFSAFWSTLAIWLGQAPFHLDSDAAGLFGLAAAVGALAAPLTGRRADRRGAPHVIRLGIALAAGGYLLLCVLPLLERHTALFVLGLAVFVFDLGGQVALVGHQALVYGLDPAARSRLNAVFFTFNFLGMAVGALLGSWLLGGFGLVAVGGLAAGAAVTAGALRLWADKAPAAVPLPR
jgi:predicted MFS family arabinose efflux permease